ncbi:MAG: hypothetical protein ACNS60_09455 [Candidatus Cyclobacteriaceae bacterium M2_1C_046]
MKLITLTYLLFVIFLSSTYAQSNNFQEGYIINLEKDTLYGLIAQNEVNISFKSLLNNQTIDYSPSLLLGYVAGEKSFRSAYVDVELTSRDLLELTYEPELKIKKDTVFLEVIIDSDKKLLSHFTSEYTTNFYIYYKGRYELLVYKPYKLLPTFGNSYITENKTYINQLAFYLKDCSSIYPKLKGLKYKKKNLERTFRTYKKCKK